MLVFGGVYHTTQKSGISIPISRSRGRSLDVAATIYPVTKCHWNQPLILTHLGGGNSNICYFHPDPWRNDPKWRAYFSKGLVQPPTSKSCFWRSHANFLTGRLFFLQPWGNLLLGVSKDRSTPKWMVKIMENPMNKWMIWGETPTIFGNTLLKLAYKLSLSFLLSLFYRPRPSWCPMAMNGPGRGQAHLTGVTKRLMAGNPETTKDDDYPPGN